ncbi:MAG: deoxyguanosinetriphosphate triphosphohydrolase [Armatimonadetes bacterium]|nr:deoxyguanosinetriphosphate triphosphohydrolase [Candidatus Hippobium faecium]
MITDKIRKQSEENEKLLLSPKACFSCETKGRMREEDKCPIRTDFQRDRDRIIHSKSFRRLKHKAQVFISPENDHFRTRLTHSLEVFQVSVTIARALRLNEDLTGAIALGHDLGHTPFGHAGESTLNEIMKSYGLSFHHALHSLKIVDKLEKDGKGLNLTFEVRDGIARHSKGNADLKNGNDLPMTLEGQIVRISDRIAYLNHDIDDAVSAGIISLGDIPSDICEALGNTTSKRIKNMIFDIVNASEELETIQLSQNMASILNSLKDFMFEKVYYNEKKLLIEKLYKEKIKYLFEYYMIEDKSERDEKEKAVDVADYISSMTDNYAQQEMKKLGIL